MSGGRSGNLHDRRSAARARLYGAGLGGYCYFHGTAAVSEEAEIAKFTPQELREYEASKIAYRDIKNSVDTAKREGIAEGMEKGMKKGMEKKSLEIAKKMLTKGMDEATVMEITGLTAELIQQLSKSQG